MSKYLLRVLAIIYMAFTLSACITFPGHRIIVDDGSFYLHVETPSKEVRRNIRFNEDKTALLNVPERVHIKLIVLEDDERHRIDIQGKSDSVEYAYKINGKKIQYYPRGEEFFATQVPRIMSEMGYVDES